MKALNRPLRVLIVEPAGQLWGSERSLLANLAAMPAGSVEVGVCLPPSTPLAPHLRALGCRLFPTLVPELHRRSALARVRAIAAIATAAARFRPDVIHVNQAGASRIALLAARLRRTPVTAHVQIAEDVAYLEALGSLLSDLASAVCISDAIRALFDPAGPLGPERLPTFYYPVAMPDAATPDTPDVPSRVACVGRLVPVKGQDVLLDALAVLDAAGDAPQAVFVGTSPEGNQFDADLRAQAERLGVENLVTWVGFDPEPMRHVRGAVAAVIPSRHEPFGLVVVEAWAAGNVPVVWAGSGGAAEIVRKSGGGLLYSDQTGPGLAEALRRAARLDADERADLVTCGQAWVRHACAPATQASRMLDVWVQAARRDTNAR